jgi:transcriptional/translational regulatory protein YebC/TACO1
MEDALEAGASDFEGDEGVFEIYTEPDDVYAVGDALTAKGYKLESAERTKVPSTYVTLSSDDDIANMQNLLDKLEDNDDITNVYHNWEN